jgi:hypothetical protein
MMAENAPSGPVQIHSEPRGDHWVAWATRGGNKPDRGIVVVGKTQEEAEAHARAWTDQGLH